jgi:carbon monoxide dehydrogenase subunit G
VVSWGSVKVAAAPEAAFAVLTDYTRMTDFLPGLLTSEVLSRQGNTVVVAQIADEGVLLFRHRVDVRLQIVESPPHRLSLRALAGSFKEFDGSYQVSRKPDHTLIEYRARFLPDFHLPPMIGTYAVQRSLERHLDALAAEIERRAKKARPVSAPPEDDRATGSAVPEAAPAPPPMAPRGE